MQTTVIILIIVILLIMMLLILRLTQFRKQMNDLINEQSKGKNRSFQIEMLSDTISTAVIIGVFFFGIEIMLIAFYNIYF